MIGINNLKSRRFSISRKKFLRRLDPKEKISVREFFFNMGLSQSFSLFCSFLETINRFTIFKIMMIGNRKEEKSMASFFKIVPLEKARQEQSLNRNSNPPTRTEEFHGLRHHHCSMVWEISLLKTIFPHIIFHSIRTVAVASNRS